MMRWLDTWRSWICRSCRKGYRPSRTLDDDPVCPRCGEGLIRRWRIPWRSFHREFRDRAARRSVSGVAAVFVLTLSLAMDAIGRFGFVPLQFNGLSWLGFVVHELGHLAATFLPQTVMVASGTLFQLALPALSIGMFVRNEDDAAACYAGSWLACTLQGTASYMGDARLQEGDMAMSAQFWSLVKQQAVNPDQMGHDWNYLLGKLGILSWDRTLSWMTSGLACAIAVGSVILCGAQLWYAWDASRSKDAS